MDHHHRRPLLSLMFIALVAAFAASAFAADPPVTVTFATTGSPAPGATVSVKATVKVNDGSTVQSLTWKQTGGLTTTLSNTTTDTVTIVLPSRKTYKEHLIEVLEEFPVAENLLPAKTPTEHFFGGLQDRFTVVASSPHAIIDAGAIPLNLEVKTTSGTYNVKTTVAAKLPWPTAIGARNVPIGVPVLLHGKTQASYDWTMTRPGTSQRGADRRHDAGPRVHPRHRRHVRGDGHRPRRRNAPVTAVDPRRHLDGHHHRAGRERPAGRRHRLHDLPRAEHALLRPVHAVERTRATPRSSRRTSTTRPATTARAASSCHTVGYDKTATNGGIDDAPRLAAFVASGLLTHGAADNWTKILAQFPATAKLANIQCENCHGPHDSAAHMKKDGSRKTPVVGPVRHLPRRAAPPRPLPAVAALRRTRTTRRRGRGDEPRPARSATARQGFIQWANNGFGTAAIKVDWTADEVHPQTCADLP